MAGSAAIGVALAVLVLAAWLAAHVAAIFLIDWAHAPWWLAPLVVLGETWLFVGLFIVAHDAMHGALVPGHPRANRWVGRICLALYAALSYDRMAARHRDHHRYPGTAADPDFDPDHPRAFLPWFGRFMWRYYGWRDLLAMAVAMTAYLVLLGPPVGRLLAFYALPAILSAVQLFYFGTFRPHRHDDAAAFADHHNARSEGFPWLVSLLTCFHFGGYHHEHHLSPGTPWWRLPARRRALAAEDKA
ncbi:fatty acid desaturase [Acuticoccus sp. 2012]|uniref:Fatty acid desaturase n=2 Tax=Acuticoccus mangrovi TaxID=2796142 RepID=A0A934IVE6_9HYPH|nr:fatty acid desaturase [Acuticoccus mangrovi]MBJ3778740.1 fatty acid desaturase [Acuticoccus mangrovi]